VACVGLDHAYTTLRLVKSDEEVAWLRAGAWLSDLGIAALTAGLRPGVTEHEAVALATHAYAALGGSTHICYLASTAMDDPDRCVPGQLPTTRRLAAGDVVVVELSAAFHGYAGQVLRTFTIDAPLSPLHRRLHAVAEVARDAMLAVVRDGTTPAQLRDAAGVIEDAGLTTCDDVVHGFGGGYLPPVVASRSHADAPLPEQPLAAGMTIVVQPNVVTPDGRAGVQTGELVLVTATGHERLHTTAPGVITAGTTTAVRT
jgi:Xaa-Pro aminopeptidase